MEKASSASTMYVGLVFLPEHPVDLGRNRDARWVTHSIWGISIARSSPIGLILSWVRNLPRRK